MDKKPLHSYGRFRDPLGDYIKAAQATQVSQGEDSEKYPFVDDTYKGFYASFKPMDKEGERFLGSSEGIIGTELVVMVTEEGLGFFAHGTRRVTILDKSLANELRYLLDSGWILRCFLAFTIFEADNKTFSAQFACFCYKAECSEEQKNSLERFIHNMIDRIASATHPGLALSQEQFVRVLESKGEWYLTKDEPWPELPKGSVYYRRRRTFNDRLIGAALKGNTGCVVASWIGTIIVLAVIVCAIWFFFFSS